MYRGSSISGDGRGKKMGFPTINIQLSMCDMGKLFSQYPEGGVFIVKTYLLQESFSGLLHLGKRPTFNSDEQRVEIFLLQFSKHIPQETGVHFEILKKIRPVEKFNTQEALIQQITKDRNYAEEYLKLQ